MTGLAFTGLGMAAAAAASALLMSWMLSTGPTHLAVAVAGLSGAACGLGLLRAVERVLAEKLGQDYVHEIRLGLVRSSLSAGSRTPLGITVARTTNDLSSVRNWIALGLAPLTVAVPLILGTVGVLWMLSPPLAVAGVIPICALTVVLGLLSRPALGRARDVRRRRGRLAAHLADTVTAASTIHAAGGSSRELRRIDQLGERLIGSAVKQAAIAGYLRGAAAAAAALSVVAVAGTGAWLNISTATIAAALTVIGLITAPLSEIGRIVEYRQKFLAARGIIGPALNPSRPAPLPKGIQAHTEDSSPHDILGGAVGIVSISGLSLENGNILPPLIARPGDRIVIGPDEPDRTTAICRSLLGLRPGTPLRFRIDGRDLMAMPPGQRRTLVGYASRGADLERGSIARALRYRRPDLPAEMTGEALARVGLAARVADLPAGERTVLRGGGQPLTRSERARLQLARALLGDPPVLVLDHIDSDLGNSGSRIAEELLRAYPGVVLIASETPELLVRDYRLWATAPG